MAGCLSVSRKGPPIARPPATNWKDTQSMQDHPISTLTIKLIGSHTARHLESGTTVDLTNRRNRSTTKSAIPVLCRELIAHGLSPDTRVHVVRKAIGDNRAVAVFDRDRRLSAWAAIDVIENEARSVRTVPHRPYRGPVKAKNKRQATGSTAGTSGTPRPLTQPTEPERSPVL